MLAVDHANTRHHIPPFFCLHRNLEKRRPQKKQKNNSNPPNPPTKQKQKTNKQTTKKSYSQNTKNKNSFTGYNVAVVNAHTRHHTPPSFCLHRNVEKTTTNKQPVIEFYWT